MKPSIQTIARFVLSAAATVCLVSCQSAGPQAPPITLDEDPPPPAAGQWFEYQHTGPRPWSAGEGGPHGARRVEVLGSSEEAGQTLWAVRETFEGTPDHQVGLYDSRYRLHRQLIRGPGGELLAEFSKPIPARHLDLKPDETETVESVQTLINPSGGAELGQTRIKIVTERRRDERVVTPAGAYLCRHFHKTTELVSTLMIPGAGGAREYTVAYSAVEDAYWSDGIGWFVREAAEFKPVIQDGEIVREGYATESVLTAFEQNPAED